MVPSIRFCRLYFYFHHKYTIYAFDDFRFYIVYKLISSEIGFTTIQIAQTLNHFAVVGPFSAGVCSSSNDFDVLLLLKIYFHSLHPVINKYVFWCNCHCFTIKIRWLIISQRPLINTINLPFDINLGLVKTVKNTSLRQ